MAVTDLSILGLLKTRMHWHEARQRVLAENVANADMPGFVPRDLVPMTGRQPQRLAAVAVEVTHAAHVIGQATPGGSAFGERSEAGWETTPDGNAVVLEEQMMKVAENQMDHQMATTLYGRALALMRAAVSSG